MVGLLFAIVVNFSEVESNFECSGEMTSDSISKPSTIHIKLNEYRWWVSLWSESDGNFCLEIPNTHVQYYSNVLDLDPQIQIQGHQKELKGDFSKLSKTLALDTPVGFFDGTCRVTN
jgi:hypothetical protein